MQAIRLLMMGLSLSVVGSLKAESAFLGVQTEEVPGAVAAQLGLEEGIGLIVGRVEDGSPAGIMLKEHDVLHKYNGEVLRSPDQLHRLVSASEPGNKAKLVVIRGGKAMDISVVLGERPAGAKTPPRARGNAGVDPNLPFDLDIDVDAHFDAEAFGKLFEQQMEGLGAEFDQMFRQLFDDQMKGFGAELQNLFDQLDQLQPRRGGNAPAFPAPRFFHQLQPNARAQHSSSVTISENGFKVTVKTRNGDKQLKAVDRDGDVVFEGPVNTDEEIDKLPADVRRLFDRMDIQVGPGKAVPKPPKARKRKGVQI